MEKAEQPITFIVRRADVKEGSVEGRPRGAQLVLCEGSQEVKIKMSSDLGSYLEVLGRICF